MASSSLRVPLGVAGLALLACLSLQLPPGAWTVCFIPPSCDFNVQCNMTVDEDECFCGWKSTGWTIVNKTRPDNSSYKIATFDPEKIPRAVLYSVIRCPGLPPPHCLKLRFKLETDTEIVVMLHENDNADDNCTVYKALTSVTYNAYHTALISIPYAADWISIEANRLARPYQADVSLREVDYLTQSCDTIPVEIPIIVDPGVNISIECFPKPPKLVSHSFEIMIIGAVIVAIMIGVCIAFFIYSRNERPRQGKNAGRRNRRSEGKEGGKSSRQGRDNYNFLDDKHLSPGAAVTLSYDASLSSLENHPRHPANQQLGASPANDLHDDEETGDTRRTSARGRNASQTSKTPLTQNSRASPRDYGTARRREGTGPGHGQGQGRSSAFRSPSQALDDRGKQDRRRSGGSSGGSKKRGPPRPVVKAAYHKGAPEDYQHVDFTREGRKGENPRNIYRRFGDEPGLYHVPGAEKKEERVNIVDHEQY